MSKVDRELPAGKAQTTGVAPKLGKYRCHKDWDKDEFHVHDDDLGHRFAMAGIRQWELAAKNFLETYHFFPISTVVVFRGISTGSAIGKAAGRTLCDLVFSKLDDGTWATSLVPAGCVQGNVIMGDPVMMALDELVQRT